MTEILRIGQDANGTLIDVRSHQVLEVTLPESRMSGYRWTLGVSGDSIRHVSDEFVPAQEGVGGTGTHRWQFEAVAPGACRIEMSYSRPWEDAAAARDSFRLRVRVSATR